MNTQHIASSFLRWYANIKKEWAWELALQFYLDAINEHPSDAELKEIKKIIRATIRRLNQN